MKSQYKLNDERNFVIRKALPSDAQAIIDYTNAVSGESDNLTFGPGEFEITYDQEMEFIEKVAQSDNSMMLLGLCENQIVSVLNLSGMARPRVHHFAEIGITVLKSHWHLGIGRIMMQHSENVAQLEGVIRRIHLKVRTDNEHAVALYKKMGYEIEGCIKRQFLFLEEDGNEVFVDVFAMGKNLDS